MHGRNGRESRLGHPLNPTIPPVFAFLLIILQRRRCAKVVTWPQLAYKWALFGGGRKWGLINNVSGFPRSSYSPYVGIERSGALDRTHCRSGLYDQQGDVRDQLVGVSGQWCEASGTQPYRLTGIHLQLRICPPHGTLFAPSSPAALGASRSYSRPKRTPGAGRTMWRTTAGMVRSSGIGLLLSELGTRGM